MVDCAAVSGAVELPLAVFAIPWVPDVELVAAFVLVDGLVEPWTEPAVPFVSDAEPAVLAWAVLVWAVLAWAVLVWAVLVGAVFAVEGLETAVAPDVFAAAACAPYRPGSCPSGDETVPWVTATAFGSFEYARI